MATKLFVSEEEAARIRVCHDRVEIRTRTRVQFIDVTDLVAERVRRARVASGVVSVQALDTTAAILVGENEPVLVEELEATVDRVAPELGAHARAALLGPSACLNVFAGVAVLGGSQGVFLVDLDGPRPLGLSILVMGVPEHA
jgi:secondary thiamine-phosphate synthase enzyme